MPVIFAIVKENKTAWVAIAVAMALLGSIYVGLYLVKDSARKSMSGIATLMAQEPAFGISFGEPRISEHPRTRVRKQGEVLAEIVATASLDPTAAAGESLFVARSSHGGVDVKLQVDSAYALLIRRPNGSASIEILNGAIPTESARLGILLLLGRDWIPLFSDTKLDP